MSDTGPSTLLPAVLRESLRTKLAARAWAPLLASTATPSAVLVPLFAENETVRLWFVRRASTLRRHGGQVAFPGGKTDPAETPLETALREAQEEIGLPRDAVDVLGRLDDRVTGTGFKIAPFVGWLPDPFTPVPSDAEVARVFSVPLRAFLDKPRGIPPFQGYNVEGERVWGATGKIIRDLLAVVQAIS